MTRRSKRPPASRSSPGGPGAMEALRRAQEKLKKLGVKLYKWEPPTKAPPKGEAPAQPKAEPKPAPAPAPKRAPKRVAPKRAPAAAKRVKSRAR